MKHLAALLVIATVLVVPVIAQGHDWTPATTASSPSAGERHAMAYDDMRGKVVLFGGWGSSGGHVNDTWEYDGSNWTQVTTANSPSARTGHAMVYDEVYRKVVLFGGNTSLFGNYLSDTWEYDGVDWTQVTTSSGSPCGRERHAMAYDGARGTTVMFGGTDGPGFYFNDTWEYDGVDWTQVMGPNSPSARAGHAMACGYGIHGRVVMFGGLDGSTNVNDTWEYDGWDWTQVTTASSPSVRNSHAMTYDALRAKVVVFGGYDLVAGGSFNDTWEYDGVDWTQVTTASSPGARTGHAMAYNGKVVMFGGYVSGVGYLEDTWEYDLTTTASSVGFGSGCPAAQPLALNSNLPLLGTTWQLTASSVDPASPLCFFWFGVTAVNPGVDLGFIGAAGCFAYTNANLGAFLAPVTSGSGTFTVSVPNNATLLAYALTVQASAASNSTTVGFVTSNGLTGVLGNQ